MTYAPSEADNIGWKRLRFGEFGPVVLAQQLERELELVIEWQPPYGLRDRRLVRDHRLHVSQAPPGGVWR